jgi:hypothetical protein
MLGMLGLGSWGLDEFQRIINEFNIKVLCVLIFCLLVL